MNKLITVAALILIATPCYGQDSRPTSQPTAAAITSYSFSEANQYYFDVAAVVSGVAVTTTQHVRVAATNPNSSLEINVRLLYQGEVIAEQSGTWTAPDTIIADLQAVPNVTTRTVIVTVSGKRMRVIVATNQGDPATTDDDQELWIIVDNEDKPLFPLVYKRVVGGTALVHLKRIVTP